MSDYRVIDADGHVLESAARIKELLGPRGNRARLFYQADAWDRDLEGTLGRRPAGPREQLGDMDEDGVDVGVLYPTAALGIGLIADDGYAAALAAAYNTWLHEFCQENPARLKLVALLAPQNLAGAMAELRRAVTELGAVAAMLPTHIPLRPDWGHEYWDPLYAEAARLDVALAFHHT